MRTQQLFDVNCLSCPNRNCSLLNCCDDNWVSFINDNKTVLHCKKGHHIINEETPVNGIYFILSGKVKVYKTGLGNKKQIIRLARNGDIVGHRGINRKFWPISATAIEDSFICFISNENFEKVVMSNPKLGYQMVLFFSDELFRSEEIVKNLSSLMVREKVAYALMKISESYPVFGNKIQEILLSRQDIAELAGTTKEQVSKHLNEFVKENIISFEGKRILVNNFKQLEIIANFHSTR